MDPPYAHIECCLKVHSKCPACVMKTMGVLRSIVGVYSVNWEPEQNSFKVLAQVDPSILLKAVLDTGEHAKVVSIKMNHPVLAQRQRYYNYGSTSSRTYPPYYRDGYRSSMPPNIPYYHETNHRYYPNGVPPQIGYTSSNYNTTYDYQNTLPRAIHVPSNPYQEYHDPYYNYEGMNLCTIM